MFNFDRAFVQQFPSGKWGFVGLVPVGLRWEFTDIEDVRIAVQSGPGLARRIAEREGRVFRTRVWETQAEALAAAAALKGEG